MSLTAEMSLGRFYTEYYKPVCIGESEDRTFEAYEQTLKYWKRFTGDPPLKDITAITMRKFANAVKKLPGRRGPQLAANSVRKHMRHLQAVLDHAGPPDRNCRDAAGLLTMVPWIKPPREEIWERNAAAVADIVKLYYHCDFARFPVLENVAPGNWWRGCISTICCTSLRIGQVTSIPMDCVDWNGMKLGLPPGVSRKGRRGQTCPLHIVALRDLMTIRGPRELLLPWPHAKTTLYKQLHWLQDFAEIPTTRGFAFHGMRRAVLEELAKKSPTAAQKAAGHASFRTTLNHYLSTQSFADAIESSEIMQQLDEA